MIKKTKRRVCKIFAAQHKLLDTLSEIVEETEDPFARERLDRMQMALLGPQRQIRLHWDIPYNCDGNRKRIQ